MIFYTVANGKISEIMSCSSQPSDGQEWHEAPENWGGAHGDKLSWFDDTMHRIPDHALVEQGKRVDKRGRWYHKDKTGETKLVYNMDDEPGEDWTQETPLENEQYQIFDRQQNTWVVDTEKKERAEKENAIAGVKAQIADAEMRLIRPLRAKLSNRATAVDESKYDEFDALIEDELRPELARLEDELKSA